MDYPIGCDRCLIIILLLAYVSRVADGRVFVSSDAKQEFAVNGDGGNVGGGGGGGGGDPQHHRPDAWWWGTPIALGTLGRETVGAAHRMLWGLGRFLLSAGETINAVWDVALNAALGLLRTGGAAYGAVAARVARVPVLGYGAGGVDAAVRATVAAAESTARHDMHARRAAFAALAAKLDESGKRLSGGGKAPTTTMTTTTTATAAAAAAAAANTKGTVHFPGR